MRLLTNAHMATLADAAGGRGAIPRAVLPDFNIGATMGAARDPRVGAAAVPHHTFREKTKISAP